MNAREERQKQGRRKERKQARKAAERKLRIARAGKPKSPGLSKKAKVKK